MQSIMAYYTLNAKSIVEHTLGKLILIIACIVWAHLPVCTSASVSVDVPSETWEGEGALMRCTYTDIEDTGSRLFWYKGSQSPSHRVYVYTFASKRGRTIGNFSNRIVVGRLVGNIHELYINKTFLTDEDTYACDIFSVFGSDLLTVNVKPQGVSMTGLDNGVTEDTNVTVTCDVSRVKPQAVIYWRKGLHGSLETGTTTNVPKSDKTFQLQSTYKVSFSRSEHNTQLYCLVTQPDHRDVVWATAHKKISVNYPPTTRVTEPAGTPTEGKSMTLTCNITEGRPSEYNKPVTWRKGNTVISSSSRYQLKDNKLTISFLNHTQDDGQYSCSARNSAGEGKFSTTFHLLVNYPLSTKVIHSETPTEGKFVTLTCDITDGRPTKVIKPVTWNKGGKPLPSSTRYQLSDKNLTINSLDHMLDDGHYSCAAENDAGGGDFGATFQLLVKYPPTTKVTPPTGAPTEGKSMTLTCNITEGRPSEYNKPVTWRKGNTVISSSSRYQLKDNKLTISFLNHTLDDGHYSCAARNAAGEGKFSTIFHLLVNYPVNTKVIHSATPTEGKSVTLTCDITDGRPTKVIKPVTWNKGDKPLPSSSRYQLRDKDLTITSLNHTQDDDHYSCAAENDAGVGDFGEMFQLLVHYKPTLSVETPGPVVEGQSVTITCRSQGARPAVTSVAWKKGQDIIRVTTDTKYTGGTVKNPSLTIKQTTRTDAGEYICQLSNDVGQSNKNIMLEVLYKPYGQATTDQTSVTVAVERNVSLTCLAPTEPGNPAASWFTWRKQNSDFSRNTTGVLSVTPTRVDESGKFSCVAGNWIGQSDYSNWVTVTVQAPAKVEYPNSDDVIKTPAYNDPDFKMTCTVSGSGSVDVKWQKDNISVETGNFAVNTDQVTDGQYTYGQMAAKNSTLVWQVIERARYFKCGNITHFDGHYTCAVATKTAGAMTYDMSKAFVVNVQYEAHWSSGPTLTAAAPTETSKEIVCSVCANPQPRFQWTFNNETLRKGINETGDRIVLDVVGTEDYGVYQCTASNNINGENKMVTFDVKLVESGPARAPQELSILDNHTSVALTLRWLPGFDGGHPPQTFILQYRASKKVALKPWRDIFNYTSDAMTWYGATVTGLQPQTQYVFSLYAENSRPRDQGPNRSLTVTQTGSTTATPQVTIASVKVETHKMTVEWSYNGQSSRRRRSTSTEVSVIIYYQPDDGEVAHFPLKGNVAAEERQVIISGQFDVDANYKVWLKVYEGQHVVSSEKTKPFVAKRKDPPNDSESGKTPVTAIAASVATVVVILIVISLIALLLYRRHAKNKDFRDAESKPDSMLMVSKKNEMVDGYSNVACDDDKHTDDNDGAAVYAQVNKKKKKDGTKETDDEDTVIYTDVVGTKAAHANNVKKTEQKKAEDQDDDDGDVVYSEVTVKAKQGANKVKKNKTTEEEKKGETDDDDDDVVYSDVTVKSKQGKKANKKEEGKNTNPAPKPVGKGKKVSKGDATQQQDGKNGKPNNPPVAPKPKGKDRKGKGKKKDEEKKADEGAYVNVNTGSIENNTDQNLYANVGESATSDTQKPPENVGPDGTIYADLSFARSAPAAVKQHEDGDDDDDDKVVYAAINFTKKAQS